MTAIAGPVDRALRFHLSGGGTPNARGSVGVGVVDRLARVVAVGFFLVAAERGAVAR
ncbi:hypothetical protein CLV68_1652 [Actinokineospora cianjurensis]|uniref:Uncharacterized protein n=1 Tax=Actinokineospora cianjurensis TaxID=585224 RepID=A0A421B9Y8_9PSEU|nr:hypothetical protein CLV68_1652 [Actinokineospora cianjurensis]